MDNRCKAAVVVGGLSLIFLICFAIDSSDDSSQYSAPTDDPTDLENSSIYDQDNYNDKEIMVGDKKMNLTDFMNNSRVKAFAEIHGQEFMGEWTIDAPENSILFSDFTNSKQKLRTEFSDSYFSWYQGMSRDLLMKVLIIDGSYLDDKLYVIQFLEPVYETFNITTLKYSIKDKAVNFTKVERFEILDSIECKISIDLDLSKIIRSDSEKSDKVEIVSDAPLDLRIVSDDCNFELKSTVYVDKDIMEVERKAINYSLLLTFIAIANLYSIAKIIRETSDAPAKASQISLITMGLVLIWDAYICIVHLYLALDIEKLFQFFMMPTFWYFILSSIFEAKLLIVIWRARYWNRFQNQDQARRALSCFYMKLHLSMAFLLFFLYKYILYNWCIILMSLYLVPQIIHTAMQGGRVEFDKNYVFSTLGLRFLLPLYFRGCPENIMQLRPSAGFCFLLILVVGIQIWVMFLQSVRGSKFFIPARFLPPKYNYLIELPSDDLENGVESDDCAVCMAPLHHEIDTIAVAQSAQARSVLSRLKPQRRQIMKTPCNHKFHVNCLVEWMAIKMECPTCRSALPVLD